MDQVVCRPRASVTALRKSLRFRRRSTCSPSALFRTKTSWARRAICIPAGRACPRTRSAGSWRRSRSGSRWAPMKSKFDCSTRLRLLCARAGHRVV